MKKFFKIFGITVLIIFVLLAVAPLLFKDKMVVIAKTEINNQLNAKVDFGDFGLSIFRYFPNLNFEMNDLSVSGVDAFEGDTLLRLKTLSVKVDLLSVLDDEIKILGVRLVEPHIYAHILPNNAANWDITKESQEDEPEQEEESDTESTFKMALKSFSIENANIVYEDQVSDLQSIIQGLGYQLRGDFSLSTAQLDMALLIDAITVEMEQVKYLKRANIEYTAAIQADLNQMKFDLLDNQLRLNNFILSLSGFVQMNEDDSYGMDLSFNTNQNDFKELLSLVPAEFTKGLEGVKTTGKIALKGFAKGLYSEQQLPAFNLSLDVDNASVQYPDLPASVNQIYIDLNIDNQDGVEDHTLVQINRFDLKIADNPFSAKYLVKTPISDPYIEGFVKGHLDFNKLKDAIPLDSINLNGQMQLDVAMLGNLSAIEQEQYDQFKAKGHIAMQNFLYQAADLDYDVLVEQASFEVSPQYFDMPQFDAKIGKSDFHASGRIDNMLNYYFKDETLVGAFDFNAHLIDGTELAGGETTEEVTNETDTVAASLEVIELPKNINFKLNTKIDKILYNSYEIANFQGSVRLKEGVATMEDVAMEMMGGTIAVKGTYDSRDIKAPIVDLGLNLQKISIPETYKTFVTVQKLAPIVENCQGFLNMSLDFQSVLDSHMEPVLNTLNGNGRFQSDNISIRGSESMQMMANLLHSDKFKEAKLKNIDGRFTIEDGTINIKPFDVKLNRSKATFGGQQGLDQSIDYQLDLDIPRSELGDANKLVENMVAKSGKLAQNINLGENIAACVFITGTLLKPHFSVGTKNMVKNAVEQVKEKVEKKVKEVVDEAKAKAIAEAKKQAERLMQEANRQSEKLIAETQKQADAIRKNGQLAADKAKAEAQKEIDKLVQKAGSNPIAKAAAKEAGKSLKQEANRKADQLQQEANKKANQLMSETKKKTEQIKQKAKSEGDKLIAEAEKK